MLVSQHRWLSQHVYFLRTSQTPSRRDDQASDPEKICRLGSTYFASSACLSDFLGRSSDLMNWVLAGGILLVGCDDWIDLVCLTCWPRWIVDCSWLNACVSNSNVCAWYYLLFKNNWLINYDITFSSKKWKNRLRCETVFSWYSLSNWLLRI